MKRLMSVVLSMVVVLMMCGGVMAEEFYPQGSVTVPGLTYEYLRPDYYLKPTMVLINITNTPIQCKVRVYDHSGNDMTSLGKVYMGGTNWTILSAGTGDFEIPAHSTRWFNMNNNPYEYKFVGYGVVEWSSTDPLLKKALIGTVWTMRVTSLSICDSYVPINNDQPF